MPKLKTTTSSKNTYKLISELPFSFSLQKEEEYLRVCKKALDFVKDYGKEWLGSLSRRGITSHTAYTMQDALLQQMLDSLREDLDSVKKELIIMLYIRATEYSILTTSGFRLSLREIIEMLELDFFASYAMADFVYNFEIPFNHQVHQVSPFLNGTILQPDPISSALKRKQILMEAKPILAEELPTSWIS